MFNLKHAVNLYKKLPFQPVNWHYHRSLLDGLDRQGGARWIKLDAQSVEFECGTARLDSTGMGGCGGCGGCSSSPWPRAIRWRSQCYSCARSPLMNQVGVSGNKDPQPKKYKEIKFYSCLRKAREAQTCSKGSKSSSQIRHAAASENPGPGHFAVPRRWRRGR